MTTQPGNEMRDHDHDDARDHDHAHEDTQDDGAPGADPELAALLARGLELHHAGDADGAAKLYREMLALDPDHPKALLNLASIAFDRNDDAEARRLCHLVLDGENPDDPAAHLLLARVEFRGGDHDAGFASILRAYRAAPADRGIAYEYMAAVRRRYWTYRPDEFRGFVEQAEAGTLSPVLLARLTHLAFARIVRPDFIRLLVSRAKDGESDEAIIPAWKQHLNEREASDLDTLVATFQSSLTMMHASAPFRPRRATVTLRDGTVVNAPEFTDADALTGATLEVIDREGEPRFIPLSLVRSAEFGSPGAITDVVVRLTDGSEIQGVMPAFYLFTEFCPDEDVREGRLTVFRSMTADLRLVVGLREWRTEQGLTPALGAARLDITESVATHREG